MQPSPTAAGVSTGEAGDEEDSMAVSSSGGMTQLAVGGGWGEFATLGELRQCLHMLEKKLVRVRFKGFE